MSNFAPPNLLFKSAGFDHIVVTPNGFKSASKYVNGAFCIFLSVSSPTTHKVTSCFALASVFESQKPIFACPPPFVLTMSTDLFSTFNAEHLPLGDAAFAVLFAAWKTVARDEHARLNENLCGVVDSRGRERERKKSQVNAKRAFLHPIENKSSSRHNHRSYPKIQSRKTTTT